MNLNGFTDYVVCPSPFVYFGLTCVNFKDGTKSMNFLDADSTCIGKEAIYFPTHQYQNLLFAVGMKEKGIMKTIWIGIKKIDGRWFDTSGLEIKPHMFNWATNEPSTSDECVIADSNLK